MKKPESKPEEAIPFRLEQAKKNSRRLRENPLVENDPVRAEQLRMVADLTLDHTDVLAKEASLILMYLPYRYRPFAEAYTSGMTGEEAAKEAGFANPKEQAKKMLYGTSTIYRELQKAVEYLQQRNQLNFGISNGEKRFMLLKLIRQCSDENRPGYNASAAVRCINELNLMDGSHVPKEVKLSGSVAVSMNYQIDIPIRAESLDNGVTIDG